MRQVHGSGLQGRQALDLLPAARGRSHRGHEERPDGVGLQGEVPRHHRLQQTVRAPDHGLAEQGPPLCPHQDRGPEPRHPNQQHRLDEAGAVDEDVNTGMIRLNINVVPISSNFSFG